MGSWGRGFRTVTGTDAIGWRGAASASSMVILAISPAFSRETCRATIAVVMLSAAVHSVTQAPNNSLQSQGLPVVVHAQGSISGSIAVAPLQGTQAHAQQAGHDTLGSQVLPVSTAHSTQPVLSSVSIIPLLTVTTAQSQARTAAVIQAQVLGTSVAQSQQPCTQVRHVLQLQPGTARSGESSRSTVLSGVSLQTGYVQMQSHVRALSVRHTLRTGHTLSCTMVRQGSLSEAHLVIEGTRFTLHPSATTFRLHHSRTTFSLTS